MVLAFASLTNCMSFEKSSLWVSEYIDVNTKQDPATYNEERKIEYKTYRQYLQSLDRLHQKTLLEQIKDDKSLEKSIEGSKQKKH